MSAERKKLLWISVSAGVVVLLVLVAGFFVFAPKKGEAQAPASIANNSPPKAQDPQDFLSAPPAPPSLEQPKNQDGGVIIVYGDKPNLSSSAGGAGAASGAASNAAQSGAQGQASSTPSASSTNGTGPGAVASPAPTAQAPVAAAKSAPASKASPAKAQAAAAPAAAKGAAKTSAKAKSPAKDGQFWIQAASFTSRNRADELKQGLAEKGIASLISVKDISGSSWYRVRIGPYSVESEAQGWLSKIQSLDGCAAAYLSKSDAPARSPAPAKP
jgi:cell division septation protein DedD